MRWLLLRTFFTLVCTGLWACDKAAVNIEALNSGISDGVSSSAPVITPTSATGLKLKAGQTQTFTASVSDADGDSLVYSWKLNGVESAKLLGTNNTATLTSDTDLVGEVNVSLTVSDGVRSATYTWTTQVNHFDQSCNDIENLSQSNKTCVYSGIASIGDGMTPVTEGSSIFMRPTDIVATASGDLFVADESNHVIWFWNRSAADQTMLGMQVPAGKIRVVVGVGNPGVAGSASPIGTTQATRNALSSPSGIVYDGAHLYVSSTGANAVIRVDSLGGLESVISTGCSSPRGLARSANSLYVACYSSSVVKAIDVVTLVATTAAGTGSASNSVTTNASPPTTTSDGTLNGPFGLAVDGSGNLFISEYGGCRIRVLNLSGALATYFGTWTVPSGNMRTILGVGGASSCSAIMGEAASLTVAPDARINQPRMLSFSPEGHLLIASSMANQIVALNFSATSASFLGQTIPSYQIVNVAGLGTSGYSGEGGLAVSTRFSYPARMTYDPLAGDYFVADYSNYRLRRVSSSDNKTALVAGNGSVRALTSATQSTAPVSEEKMNGPRQMIYDAVNGLTFVADSMNYRIRQISKHGVVSQAVGTGLTGTGMEDGELPTNTTMNTPSGVTLTHSTASFGGHLVWTDTANHRIRIWNRSSSAQTFFGVSVAAGRVATIGGGSSSGNLTTGPALASAFNQPTGLAWDPTAATLYVADTTNHCIKAIDSAGQLSIAAGTCGTAGNLDGAPGTGRLNSPQGLTFYRSGATEGLFIADRGNSRVRFLRTAGSGLFAGTTVALGQANSVAGGGTFYNEGINASLAPIGQVYGVAATATKLCFSSYSFHNVRCVNLTSGAIQTVMGPRVGTDDTTPEWFGGTSLSATGQNGVLAYSADGSGGLLLFPYGLTTVDDNTLLVNEYQSSLVRKIKF